MTVFSLDLYKGRWHIYAIVCEYNEKEFVVKIGVSSTPYERYEALLPGIPFRGIMLYCPVGSKKRTYGLESALHKHFKNRNTRGEWFRFSLDEKAEFHAVFKSLYLKFSNQGRPLEWTKITEENVNLYRQERDKKKASSKERRRKFELAEYRMGGIEPRKWAE